jgi:hypothetical protein
MQTLTNLNNSYVMGVQLKSNSNAPEPDRMQHDFPATYVIVWLCSSGTFIDMFFHSHKEAFGMHLKECCYCNFPIFKEPVTDSCEQYYYILCYTCLKESDHAVCEHSLAFHGIRCLHYVSIM